MAINNKTWSSNEKITSANLNKVTADAVNTADNIHPQHNYAQQLFNGISEILRVVYQYDYDDPFGTNYVSWWHDGFHHVYHGGKAISRSYCYDRYDAAYVGYPFCYVIPVLAYDTSMTIAWTEVYAVSFDANTEEFTLQLDLFKSQGTTPHDSLTTRYGYTGSGFNAPGSYSRTKTFTGLTAGEECVLVFWAQMDTIGAISSPDITETLIVKNASIS